jgi:Na+-driven multidrug efflux pump
MRIFIADTAVIGEGIKFLRIVAFSWAFFGGLMVVQGAFRGAGFTKHAMALSFLSRWLFRIPVMFLLAYVLRWGAIGLWWGYTITNVVAFAIGALWFAKGTWKSGILDDGENDESPDDDPMVDTSA